MDCCFCGSTPGMFNWTPSERTKASQSDAASSHDGASVQCRGAWDIPKKPPCDNPLLQGLYGVLLPSVTIALKKISHASTIPTSVVVTSAVDARRPASDSAGYSSQDFRIQVNHRQLEIMVWPSSLCISPNVKAIVPINWAAAKELIRKLDCPKKDM